jgi:hypothetical protein|tara:strand:+ start:1554 stop:2327 length:774 start_codon:yes stop_codon:yes gene_type:complete
MEQDRQVIKVEKFIKECKTKLHYEDLIHPGDQFNGWKEKTNIMNDYAKWIIHESNCPSLLVNIPVPHEEMNAEAEALINRYVKHRGSTNPGWSSITIHGQATDRTQPPNHYIENGIDTEENSPPMGWTDIAEQCPVTVDWLTKKWPFKEYQRCRFMLLEPGGYIQPHQDYDVRSLAAFNVSLSNPPGIEFALEDAGLIPWEPGQARGIDIGRKHAVLNRGTQNRIHMIVHGKWGEGFERHICESFETLLINIAAIND